MLSEYERLSTARKSPIVIGEKYLKQLNSDVENAKKELGYEPKYDCLKLFEDYKKEMEIKRFKELRGE